MTSRLQRKTSSILAAGGIAALIAFIVLLWCVFARQGATPPPATPPPPILGPTEGPRNQPSVSRKGEEPLLPSHILGYVNDVNTELVRLVKVGPPPINGHDFIYDLQKSPLNTNTSNAPKEHHSGHFRHPHTELWDPHPQYIIEAFGIKLHLSLRHSNTQQTNHLHSDSPDNEQTIATPLPRLPPALHITHAYQNYSKRVRAPNVGLRQRGCFYNGVVLGEEKSSHVAVSLCGGMTGYIRAKEGNFYIEPAEVYQNSSSQTSVLHRIHRISTSSSHFDASDVETCDTITDAETDYNNKIIFDDIFTETSHRISKRSQQTASYQSKNREYYIEILVVADQSMAEYHKTNETLTHYILTLMSHVSLLYKDATIGNPVSMYVKDIMILPEKVFVERRTGSIGVNSAEMLRNFCAFQEGLKGGFSSGFSHDVALLLTRETICRDAEKGQCDTLGLAELGTMCSSQSSCAIIKDKGLPTSYTIAHELGHVLNMPHDDDEEKCSRFNENESGVKYIMGRMIRNDSKPWLWSNCSRRYLTEYLESKRAGCLLEKPKQDLVADHRSLPGENFNANKQCELVFGRGLKLCPYIQECTNLWCELDGERDGGCQTHYQPWADGTPCGPHSWCHHGACLPRDPAILFPVAGGWGPWQRPGACSRTCGGGVRRVERDCDSPRPRNGGPYCIGASVRYESCHVEPCGEEAEEFRELQCAKFNGNTMGVPGLTGAVKWVPKYEGKEHCALYCRVAHTNQHYLLSERVVDGTKCGFNSHDLCVAGTCRRGGCDNRLGSSLTLDACGVCGGDNSQCEQIEGGYHARPQYGYSKVVRIPKGSSNLDIRQHGWDRDGNYLALVDSETGAYVMNGNHILHAYPTMFMYGGVTLSYTGTNVPVERINSTNSVRLKKDLLVELLSVDKLLPPNITYTYMIARGNSPMYSWQLYEGSWGPCSRACSGVQRALPLCTALSSGEVVGEEHCEHLPRDGSTSVRDCNTHCRLSWRAKHHFPCSSACGPGLRTIVYQCVRLETTHHELELDEAPPVDDQHCSDLERPPEVEKCNGSCEETRWKYDEWSECSRSCGGGLQHRTAYCVSSSMGPTLDPVHCAGAAPPVTAQPCNTQRCPTWSVAEWTACNVSCGRGWRLRPYFCHAEGRVLRAEACDVDKMPTWKEECTAAGRPSCARWDTGPWLPCVDCQPTQHRQVQCRDQDGTVSEGECAGLLRPNETRACPPSACAPSEDTPNSVLGYEWRSGPWSECTRSCGGGAKSRNVACQDSVSGALVGPEKCDPVLRPVARVLCGAHKCPKWNTGDWSECSGECMRYRLVICQEAGGGVLPPARCPASERPTNSTPCKHCTPAPRYKWRIGEWSPCSRSCGRGLRLRSVTCVDITQNATLVDQFCQQKKPKVQRPCHKSACTHVWQEGPWTACTQSCGPGMRYRNVTCHRVLPHGRSAPSGPTEHTCDPLSKPNDFEKCYNQNCPLAHTPHYVWSVGPWKPCSHSCGAKGRQIRYIYCQYNGKKVPKKFCPRNLKPQRKQKCNQIKCSPRTFKTCLDVKRGLHTVRDGEYQVSVGPTIITIYCHKMSNAIPEEFLTLKDDGRENYSEVYGKQLLEPDSCPNLGLRDDHCPCRGDDSGTAGLTMFYRVKLNITSLLILPDDFTFSRQISGVQIPFATAGDCYSRGECPQGRFAINLEGTGFKLHEKVQWRATGVHASLSISRQRNSRSVSGKCGGYCGSCAPDGLGLLLEPDGGT